ncbi:hypothetical protein GCM10009588_14880 [Microbacterium phyllosphaerae]
MRRATASIRCAVEGESPMTRVLSEMGILPSPETTEAGRGTRGMEWGRTMNKTYPAPRREHREIGYAFTRRDWRLGGLPPGSD